MAVCTTIRERRFHRGFASIAIASASPSRRPSTRPSRRLDLVSVIPSWFWPLTQLELLRQLVRRITAGANVTSAGIETPRTSTFTVLWSLTRPRRHRLEVHENFLYEGLKRNNQSRRRLMIRRQRSACFFSPLTDLIVQATPTRDPELAIPIRHTSTEIRLFLGITPSFKILFVHSSSLGS